MSIFRLFDVLVFIVLKGVFFFLGYRKMAIFGPNPWVNPFGKMSIFRFIKLLVFIA